MKKQIIISDFDGVIGDSLGVALSLTQNIVDLFPTNEEVKSFADYYRLFGRQSESKIVTTEESQTVRELHRILVRYHSDKINLFAGVTETYSKLSSKPIIVSSTYADVIKNVLENFANKFEFIYGYESGHKKEIFKKLVEEYEFTYVTDTLRDIEICKAFGIPVIATCWGYDSKEKLESGKPDYIANDFSELENILTKLNFIKNGK